MDSSRTVSERAHSRNSSIFGSAHTVNRRLLESPGGGMHPTSSADTDNDLEVEDYGSVGSDLEFSDSDYDDDYNENYEPGESYDDDGVNIDESMINDLRLALRTRKDNDHTESANEPDEGNDDDEADSEEEVAIVAQIRDEIKNQIRGEMKDELEDLYMKPSAEGAKTDPDDDPSLNELEPKLKEAILKMRKYDRILAKKERREKKVKRDRLRLQQRLRQELDDLKNGVEGKQPRKDELVNTEKFLALEQPPWHNEDIELESTPVTPVFPTQLPDSEFGEGRGQGHVSSKSNASQRAGDTSDRAKENLGPRTTRSHSDGGTSSCASTSLGGKMSDSSFGSRKRSEKKRKDFIKRNIELAGDSANIIAMTDDEKSRLEFLLNDISNMPDIPENGDHFSMQAFELTVVAGDGYRADCDQREQLSRIDDRLSVLVPERDFVTSSANNELDALKHCQYLSDGMRLSMDLDQLGEAALKETREEREMRLKLEAVEKQLELLSVHADLDISTPDHLSEDMLNILLGEYAQSLPRVTQSQCDDEEDIGDDRSSETPAPVCIYDNVPRLDDDTLQRLLREARTSRSDAMSYNELAENASDDTKALKMGDVTDRNYDSASTPSSSRQPALRRLSDADTPLAAAFTSPRPPRGTGGADRPESEARGVSLPEINRRRCVVSSQLSYNQRERPPSTDERRSDNNFVHSGFDHLPAVQREMAASVRVSPPPLAPPRRPPLKPRTLSPISTHLDLNLSDEEVEK